MKIRVPDYFNKFKCIASECKDTCCAGWGIVIDEESYDKYQKVKGPFGERLKSEIVSEGSENIFVLKGNNCPFLNENNLCDIYSNLGEDGLCYTCKQYPRYKEEFGGLREVGISLSCEEAARIILEDSKKVSFEISEIVEEISSYNDINATLFIELLQCRKVLIDILQDRDIHISKRGAIALKYVSEIQDKIDNSEFKKISEVRQKYLNSYNKNKFLEELESYADRKSEKYNIIHEYFLVFKNLKHINKDDILGLEDGFRYFWHYKEDEDIYIRKHNEFMEIYEENMYKFEHLLVYFTFRYFMKAVFDYDVLAKTKIAIISYIMIKELLVLRLIEEGTLQENAIVDISQRYSKDIEHLEENIERLSELFESDEIFNIENILVALIN